MRSSDASIEEYIEVFWLEEQVFKKIAEIRAKLDDGNAMLVSRDATGTQKELKEVLRACDEMLDFLQRQYDGIHTNYKRLFENCPTLGAMIKQSHARGKPPQPIIPQPSGETGQESEPTQPSTSTPRPRKKMKLGPHELRPEPLPSTISSPSRNVLEHSFGERVQKQSAALIQMLEGVFDLHKRFSNLLAHQADIYIRNAERREKLDEALEQRAERLQRQEDALNERAELVQREAEAEANIKTAELLKTRDEANIKMAELLKR